MNGQQHIKRLEALKPKRLTVEQFWRDAYNSTYPLRGAKIGNDGADALSASFEKSARIYDGTLKNSVRKLAAQLVSGLTPSAMQWFLLEATGVKDSAGMKWLEQFSKDLHAEIHGSNYDSASFEFAIDYVCAMAVCYVEDALETDPEAENLYVFHTWPLHSCYFADSTGKGKIDTLYRPYSLTAEQAVATFTDKRYPLSDEVTKAAKEKPDQMFDFVHAIYPRGKKRKKTELPWASEHTELKTKKLVRVSGYHEQPFTVGRSVLIPDSVYSLGPADDALPDHKTLNEVVKLVLSNADMAIAGMWGAVDDGVVNAKTIKVGARKIIAMASKDSFFPLKPGGDFNVGFLAKEKLQGNVKETMMSDELHPEDGPQMTAYEVARRYDKVRQLFGPMLSRLQSEHISGMIKRCAGIALRRGMGGVMPESIRGRVNKITYKAPLSQSQRNQDVMAIERFEAGLINSAKVKPDVVDVYDWEEGKREQATLLNVPAKLIKDSKAVQQLREKRAEEMMAMQKEQQKAEMMKSVAPVVARGAQENAG